MRPGKRNIEFTRGDDYAHRIEFQADGVPIDKSDCTYAAQVRTRPDVEAAVAFTIDDSSLADGVLVISLPSAATEALPALSYWDLQQIAPGPTATTILRGTLTVGKDVTR